MSLRNIGEKESAFEIKENSYSYKAIHHLVGSKEHDFVSKEPLDYIRPFFFNFPYPIIRKVPNVFFQSMHYLSLAHSLNTKELLGILRHPVKCKSLIGLRVHPVFFV